VADSRAAGHKVLLEAERLHNLLVVAVAAADDGPDREPEVVVDQASLVAVVAEMALADHKQGLVGLQTDREERQARPLKGSYRHSFAQDLHQIAAHRVAETVDLVADRSCPAVGLAATAAAVAEITLADHKKRLADLQTDREETRPQKGSYRHSFAQDLHQIAGYRIVETADLVADRSCPAVGLVATAAVVAGLARQSGIGSVSKEGPCFGRARCPCSADQMSRAADRSKTCHVCGAPTRPSNSFVW